ncbi:hypothetical protein GCM10017556_26060 [Micromonospora sagamiensis]|nr:hypothetical protein GCM10017556_26060 [Micromonospora sagamiensis]
MKSGTAGGVWGTRLTLTESTTPVPTRIRGPVGTRRQGSGTSLTAPSGPPARSRNATSRRDLTVNFPATESRITPVIHRLGRRSTRGFT